MDAELKPTKAPDHSAQNLASSDGVEPDSSPDARINFVAFLSIATICVFLGLMLARVVQLQVAPGVVLAAHGGSRVSARSEPGVRGDVLDRRGRPLAITRFAFRVFIDPVDFPVPAEEAVQKLADATDIPFEEIMRRLAPKLAENEKLSAAENDDDPWTEADKGLNRYVALNHGPNAGALEDWRVDVIRGLKLPGVHLETWPLRETPADDLVAGLLGKVGIDHTGLLGVEKMVNGQAAPTSGRIEYVRDAKGRPLWVNSNGYAAPQRGQDVRLSLDLEVQRIVLEEVRRGVEEAEAAGGRAVVMDPRTGEVLALADVLRPVPGAVQYKWDVPIGQESGGRPRYVTINIDPSRAKEASLARNRCVEDVYEPGSTFKSFMWAVATESGAATLEEQIDTEAGRWRTPYGRPVNDVTVRDVMTWREVLVNSSNIGMVKVTSRMGFDELREGVLRFGFGKRTGIGLVGESTGLVTTKKNWSKYTQTSVAMGHEVAVTPIQMARAFSAFARPGELAGTLPPITLRAIPADAPGGGFVPGVRVLPQQIAEITRDTMRGVTHNLDQRMTKKDQAVHLRYEAFGKSGTAEIPLGPPPPGKRRPKGSDGYFQGQYNSSFIAGGPVEDPRIVVIVVIDDPGPSLVASRRHYGAATAGPVVRRIMERTLSYLGVPASYPVAGSDSVAQAN